MGYDNMHRITSKRQHLTQDNVQFNGTLNVGYDLSYAYSSEEGKKFQLESVKDVNYRTEETPEGNNVENGHVYTYDNNGNLVYVNTSRMMNDGQNTVICRNIFITNIKTTAEIICIISTAVFMLVISLMIYY